jgi:hypothetical protein
MEDSKRIVASIEFGDSPSSERFRDNEKDFRSLKIRYIGLDIDTSSRSSKKMSIPRSEISGSPGPDPNQYWQVPEIMNPLSGETLCLPDAQLQIKNNISVIEINCFFICSMRTPEILKIIL